MRELHYKNEQGVISLEACIVVPMFVFLLLFFYGFIFMFAGQQLVTHALVQSSESLALDSYAGDILQTDDISSSEQVFEALYQKAFTSGSAYYASTERWYANANTVEDAVRTRFVGFLSGESETQADEILKRFGVQDGLDGMDFSQSKVENGELIITVTFKQEFIFNFQGLAVFDRSMTVVSHMW